MAETALKLDSSERALRFDHDTDQQDRYLTFALATEEYGIEIRFVTEIVGLQKITEVPDMPDFIRGVINLRGKVIPVMDMRSRFRKEPMGYHERTCIIVVDIQDKTVGLVVDKVNDVVDIPQAQIAPPPSGGKGKEGYIQGLGKIGDQVKILLDVDRLLGDTALPEDEPENGTPSAGAGLREQDEP